MYINKIHNIVKSLIQVRNYFRFSANLEMLWSQAETNLRRPVHLHINNLITLENWSWTELTLFMTAEDEVGLACGGVPPTELGVQPVALMWLCFSLSEEEPATQLAFVPVPVPLAAAVPLTLLVPLLPLLLLLGGFPGGFAWLLSLEGRRWCGWGWGCCWWWWCCCCCCCWRCFTWDLSFPKSSSIAFMSFLYYNTRNKT